MLFKIPQNKQLTLTHCSCPFTCTAVVPKSTSLDKPWSVLFHLPMIASNNDCKTVLRYSGQIISLNPYVSGKYHEYCLHVEFCLNKF